MPTIKGTDGDTTGVFGSLTTAQILALQTASSGSTPGTMSIDDFDKLATVPTGGRIEVVGASALVDITAAPGTTYAIDFPLISGKRLIGIFAKWWWYSCTGTATTTSTMKVGNNVAHDNFLTSTTLTISTGNINAAVADAIIQVTGGQNAIDLTTNPLVLEIVTNPTGITVGTGRLVIGAGYVVP